MPRTKQLEDLVKQKLNSNNSSNNVQKQVQVVEAFEKTEIPDKISEQEVYDVLEFAKTYGGGGYFNPYLSNQRMKDVNQNPNEPMSRVELEEALANPKNNEEKLRDTSQYYENTNMTYRKLLNRYGKMLSFDYTFTCENSDPEDYNSEEYKTDHNRYIKFLDKFNFKQEFQRVTQKLIREDAHFVVFRDEGTKYSCQELPAKYCKIVNRWEHGFLFDFNMMWFIANPGVDINCYPETFKKYLRRITDAKNQGYLPSNDLDERTGEYVYWVQTSPEDKLWCWKFDNVQAGQAPYFSPSFLDLFNADQIRDLQTNKYIISASRLLVGLIPMIKNPTSNNIRDNIALDPKTIGRFMNIFREGIDDSISVATGPWDDVKQFDFASPNSDVNVQNSHTRNLAASTSSPDLLYPTDKLSATALTNTIAIEEYCMKYIYPYFEDFVDYYANKRMRKFKFKIKFEGVETHDSKKRRFDIAKEAAALGMFDYQKFAAAWGVPPQTMIRRLEMSNAMGIQNKLIHIESIFNSSSPGVDGQPGRPKVDDANLNDNTERTRDTGANVDRGGEI